ncbi:hypothetical protein [Flavobacterium silvaticum]|uniref:Uncharacterized protein n=1 Tax=Flavobacterium silvaticum TaxID=1852020 RepID=A0A972FVE0_9FLAO|nr:hypothetical protein [Flavobacterium silvaticum]NMH28732.1 hypothetical protein [Flavobacterium silvaticum]
MKNTKKTVNSSAHENAEQDQHIPKAEGSPRSGKERNADEEDRRDIKSVRDKHVIEDTDRQFGGKKHLTGD